MNSLPTIFSEQLTGPDKIWLKYLLLATLTYNAFNSPNLENLVHTN